MPRQCCQRPSSWRKDGLRVGLESQDEIDYRQIPHPHPMHPRKPILICPLLNGFTMFERWLSVTANSALELKSCAKWPLWPSHTLVSCHRSGAFIFVAAMFSKAPEYGCIMLCPTISYPISDRHRQTHIIELRQLRAVQDHVHPAASKTIIFGPEVDLAPALARAKLRT